MPNKKSWLYRVTYRVSMIFFSIFHPSESFFLWLQDIEKKLYTRK